MNKKKLVVLTLIIVMVLSLSITALVGCKDSDIDGYKQTDILFADALSPAVENAIEANRLNTLKASAQLKLSVNNIKYAIKMNANLALDGESEAANSFGLSFVEESAGNANILNLFYDESYTSSGYDFGKYLFVDLGSGKNAQHFTVNALKVKEILNSKNVKIGDDQSDEIGGNIAEAVSGAYDIFDMITGMASELDDEGDVKSSALYQSKDGQSLLLRLKLDRLLKNAGTLLEVLNEPCKELGLDLNSSNLGSVLPNLTIDVIFKMTGVKGSNFDEAMLTGVEAKINVPKKDLAVKRTDEEGTEFLHVNISKNIDLGLALDFKFNEKAQNYNIRPLGSGSYINLINFETEGELKLNAPIGITGTPVGDIAIKAGDYTMKLAVDINPVNLIDVDFTNVVGVSGVIKLITDIFNSNAINYFSIKIVDKTDATNALDLSIQGNKLYCENAKLLGGVGSAISALDGFNIKQVLESDLIQKLLPKEDEKQPETGSGEESGEGSGETGSGDDNKKEPFDYAPLASLIRNMTVLVNLNNEIINVDVKNHTINTNEYGIVREVGEGDDKTTEPVLGTDGEQIKKNLGDTTITVKAVATKKGMTIDAVINNLVTSVDKTNKETTNDKTGDIVANVVVDKDGITVTAKSAATWEEEAKELDFGGISMKIDLVLKLTKFSYGSAKKPA